MAEAPVTNSGWGLWHQLMGTRPSSARLRRWGLILILLFGLALGFLQLPADPAQWSGALFNAANGGHVLAMVLGFWVALRAAADSMQAIFGINHASSAQRHILQAAFNGGYSTLHIQGGEAHSQAGGEAITKVGGPGRVQMHMENAAVFERAEGEARVLGPGEQATILDGFERLRAVIDLRDQVLNLNLWGRTRDGIRVEVEGARLVYSIARGGRELSLREPHPFEPQAALRIVYGQRVERSGQQAKASTPLSLLAARGAAFFERQLQAFIGELTLGELLAGPGAAPAREDEQHNALFLARDAIRHQFTSRCEAAAANAGIQLHWVDVGTWKLDELAQEILEDYLEENEPEAKAFSSNPYQESRSGELHRLYQELAAIAPRDMDEAGPRKTMGKLVQAYYGLFDGLKLRYGELLGKDEVQIDRVMGHLKMLTRRLERQA